MDKIEALGEGFSLRKRARKGGRKKSSALSFAASVEDASRSGDVGDEREYESSAQDLRDALEQVRREGEVLKTAPTMENIKRYRASVKAFLEFALKRILATEEKTSGTNPLRRKRYVLVSVVDRKLEKLALEVLKGQEEQMSILERVDEINGLLVDLVT